MKARARAAFRFVKAAASTWQAWVAVASVAIAGAAFSLGPRLVHYLASIPVLAALIALAQAAQRGWDATKRRWDATKDLRKKVIETLHKQADAQRWRLETASDVAAAEVMALETQIQNLSTAGQLAGMVSERAQEGTYRSRLGLMTQIREDFERMAELLAPPVGRVPPRTDAAGDDLPRIERIVVYIDDLDRCPPARVIEVLEAVHLLLAVRLFVVVVAVDPRWLLRAVAVHYRELLQTDHGLATGARDVADAVSPFGKVDDPVAVRRDADADRGEEGWATPAQYLEKIFQIPLTLPPLTPGGYASMIGWLVGPAAHRTNALPEATGAPAEGPTSGGASVGGAGPAGDGLDEEDSAAELPTPRTVERLDPMELTEDERRFMGLLGPPFITTPRSVKRFTNSYGFLNALRGDRRRSDMGGVADAATGQTYFPHRAALTLLATLIGFPTLSPRLFVEVQHASERLPDQSWCQFLGDLAPKAMKDGTWVSGCLGSLQPLTVQRWLRLINALRGLEREAAKAHLALPERLGVWAEWVVDVGRLSFQTGHAVTHPCLDLHAALTEHREDASLPVQTTDQQ
jgi:hypothetical protein